MEWLTCETDEKVLRQKYGSLKNLIKIIKKDSKELFESYESKDKNVAQMIKITSNSWKGITEKIFVFKAVIKRLNIDIQGAVDRDNSGNRDNAINLNTNTSFSVESKDSIITDTSLSLATDKKSIKEFGNEEPYFKSAEARYIFYLLEVDGPKRAKALNIKKIHYSNKNEAKKWRDGIAKKIHPDVCKHKEAAKAISKLNQLYEEMTYCE